MNDSVPELTVERLFDDPPLAGTLPIRLTFSPDDRWIAWLQPAADDRERLDLWRLDLPDGEPYRWVNATTLMDSDEALTDAEKAERERRRQFASGITTFQISPTGDWLLLPVGGVGYLFEIETGAVRAVTPAGTRQTDFRFSPGGHWISYVRAGNLYCIPAAGGEEIALTSDGGGTIANGIADFIAAEEMHRYDGHWWSPDETRIAYTRTDSTSVPVSYRYEVDADSIRVIEQRYPYAGGANEAVALKVVEIQSLRTLEIPWQHEPDDYLARVDWTGDELAVQVQSRDQRRLWLDRHDPAKGRVHGLLEERSETWVNLHDNFTTLEADDYLWTSERDGTAKLYRLRQGTLTCLTPDIGRVNRVVHADSGRVVFLGWRDSPDEEHIFEVTLPDAHVRRLSGAAGWHEVAVSPSGRYHVDRFSSLDNMGEIHLCDRDGAVLRVLVAQHDDPEHPYHSYLSEHVRAQLGSIEAEDGQRLYYRLTPPASRTGTHPLIVYVYGGPGVNRVRNEWPPLLLQLFARRGFGVLELDNRGSANREKRFEAPIHGRLGEVELRDQLAGVRFARSLDWVDGTRIGVFGHSYGGYMTLMCLARAPETFAAGVSVAPVTDWRLYDTHYTERYLGTPDENPQGYRDSEVFNWLDGLHGQPLVIHGMADDNVLFTHTTRLMKALQDRCHPFELMTYPGAKHGLQERSVAIHRFNLLFEYFERRLMQ